MTEIRKILIWPLIERVLLHKQKGEITSIIELIFVKNLLKTLGLGICSYKATSCTLNFNLLYRDVLFHLMTLIDDQTKLMQFTELLNAQSHEFWTFLLTIPLYKTQEDFISYVIHKRNLSLQMIVFFRKTFREVFSDNNVGRDRQYQLLSEDAKLIFADLSHTIDLKQFFNKLRNRVMKHEQTLQYFWTRIFMVQYGRYI